MSTLSTPLLHVEVAYARPERQRLVALQLPAGSTAMDAVAASKLLAEFPEIDAQHLRLGIHGRACAADAVLREHDRVEIYRPLIADPKDARHRRVAAGKTMKRGG
ncbi:RnfH family protein [Chitinimonas koreensis]|uniref:RnfH family protein n=1 Tax=Chitinimonas koreensis TaxID=356302 RepID=UPI0004052AD3|nr:RnfH family protein [Chitinimonas koreensis]QNM98571.1 RnfH family protein [Chitinimonas koreensis]